KLLHELGIDTAEGLLYTGDSAELYFDTLRDFVSSAAEKSEEMVRLYESENWEDYRILVHSLKSVNKMIGAADLSAQFKQMEDAGKAVDVDYIRSHHEELLDRFQVFVKKINDALGGGPAA
ncbi:MAG: Hpt domain-containing protein, partial [Lachnospiraceae bacterium]|nr:Hpt domain-containing protein [Lachnospiraceae bacterium]